MVLSKIWNDFKTTLFFYAFQLIDSNLSGTEKKLNKMILQRQSAEHKLDSFVELCAGSEVARK